MNHPERGHLAVLALLISILLMGMLLAGCGSGQKSKTVAQVDGAPITESTLRHWTAALMRSDYFEASGKQAPVGLGTDPFDRGACVAAVRGLNSALQDIGTKCSQLYRGVQLQAMSFLIAALWIKGELTAARKTISDELVAQSVQEVIASRFHTESTFKRYLREKGWTAADYKYALKRNLGEARYFKTVEAPAGKKTDQARIVRIIKANETNWRAKTDCMAGYVVWQCREPVREAPTARPTPALLLEAIVGRSG